MQHAVWSGGKRANCFIIEMLSGSEDNAVVVPTFFSLITLCLTELSTANLNLV